MDDSLDSAEKTGKRRPRGGLTSPDCSVTPIPDDGAPIDRPAVSQCEPLPYIHGPGSPMERIGHLVTKVARTNATVLITGESGTGKEVVARLIHNRSLRRRGSFVPVNVGAIPDTLLESELFGHVKGAFTGAARSRVGRFMVADKGTIFLDEIGEMPMRLQVKLLRVLQERAFEMVGSSTPRAVDLRVVAATNQNLQQLIEVKQFRGDLFYRLNVFPIHLPPLRERRMDIPPLVEHFIVGANREFGTTVRLATTEVVAALCAHDWPGNVRDLQNAVQRMCILRGDGDLQPVDLPPECSDRAPGPNFGPSQVLPESGVNLNAALDDYERVLIQQALQKTSGNKSKAANLLGLNRTTLVEKIKRKDIGVE